MRLARHLTFSLRALVQANVCLPAWSVNTRRAPSRHCSDRCEVSVVIPLSTATHDIEYIPLPFFRTFDQSDMWDGVGKVTIGAAANISYQCCCSRPGRLLNWEQTHTIDASQACFLQHHRAPSFQVFATSPAGRGGARRLVSSSFLIHFFLFLTFDLSSLFFLFFSLSPFVSLSHRMCMSPLPYPVRRHGIALPTAVLTACVAT